MINVKQIGKNFLILLSVLPLLSGCHSVTNRERDQDNSLLRAADRMRSSGNTAAAIPIYQSALERTADNKLPIYLSLGDTFIENGQLEEARHAFEQALSVDKDNQAKKRLGRCYLLAGKATPAVTIYKEAIEQNKQDAEAYNGLGVAYDLQGNRRQAQDNYRTALTINPDNLSIQSNLGLSLAFSGDYEQAFQQIGPAAERVGATAKQRHNLAIAYALSGQLNKAKELFAKDLNPQAVEENLHILRNVKHTQKPKGGTQ